MRSFLILLACGAAAGQSPPFSELSALFDYDRSGDPHLEVTPRERRGTLTIEAFSFDSPVEGRVESPVEGRVPGVLVSPAAAGPHAVVLFGHWMMPGSPLRHKGEFLEEAVVLAEAGALCLLLDSPLVRPGVAADPNPMNGQGPNAQLQMAKEWRRALDILLARADVDPARIAYVGHSFNAGVGAMLAGVEKRISGFVLMANMYSQRDYAYDDRIPAMVEERKKRGDEWIEAYFAKFPLADTSEFAKRSSPAAVFLQFGEKDEPIPPHIARLGFSYFGEPKQMGMYDAGHELNALARQERVAWLAAHLKLRPIDEEPLNAIPALK
jgi:dienelactone hydrolase